MTYVRTFNYSEGPEFSHRIEAILKDSGIDIQAGSELERVVYESFRVVYTAADSSAVGPTDDVRQSFADLAAAVELGLQLVRASSHADFPALKPHLELLNKGEVASNRRSKVTDAAANKIFELLTACYAMQISPHVEIDHPEASKGDNPDVIMDRPEGSVAVACKVLHSKHPQTLLDRVEDAIEQIEVCPAYTGIVYLNLRNVLDHEQFWPITGKDEEGHLRFGAHADFEVIERLMQAQLEGIRQRVLAHAGGASAIEALFTGKKTQPVILFYAHAMAGVTVRGRPAPVSLKYPYAITAGTVDPKVMTTLRDLSHVTQAIPGE